MADKPTIIPVSATANTASMVSSINQNFDVLAEAIEDTLSRTGGAPNQLEADVDANSQRIYNLAPAVNGGDAVNLTQVEELVSGAVPSGDVVLEVTASLPLYSTGGASPNISMPVAGVGTSGYLSASNFQAFNGKQAALVNQVNIKSINGVTLLGSGDLVISAGAAGTTTFAVTFNNSGSGDASGTVFNGSAARVISRNTLGAIGADSPALTGIPTAPTASVNTNTTQLATTAFTIAQIADDAPSKTGANASGTWGINITGNAGTATTANSANLATVANTVSDANQTANITLWTGTEAQYNAIVTKDPNTLYIRPI